MFGRSKERHERVAEDHIFSWKALIAEPCYCGAKVSALQSQTPF